MRNIIVNVLKIAIGNKMHSQHLWQFFITFGCLTLLTLLSIALHKRLVWQYNRAAAKYFSDAPTTTSAPIKRLLWWTENSCTITELNCADYTCAVELEKTQLPEADVVLFNANSMELTTYPLPRKSKQLWALLQYGSPQNMPPLMFNEFLQHFNFSSTFSHESDFPLTTRHMPNEAALTSLEYFRPVHEKNVLRAHLASTLYIGAECNTMTQRDEYLAELSRYLQIDAYGACFRNKQLPMEIDKLYAEQGNMFALMEFFGKYKFVLSIESAACDDYITEVYWRPLTVGAVPIYFGAPNIRDWEPHEQASIHIRDFDSPRALAEYINYLDHNDTEYNKYLKHKYDRMNPITNKALRWELRNRQLHADDSKLTMQFMCNVCRAVNQLPAWQFKVMSQHEYNCPLAKRRPPMKNWPLTYWDEMVINERSHAKI